jgi:hypothetical protein
MPAEAEGKEDIHNYLAEQKQEQHNVRKEKIGFGLMGGLIGYAFGLITGAGIVALVSGGSAK